MATKRAARVAAPGAPRVTFDGIMAVSDDFGRLRVLILDAGPDGRPSDAGRALRAAVPRPAAPPGDPHRGEYRPPFELLAGPLPPDAAGVRGVAWAVPPARRRDFWLAEAARLRGRWVRLEATVRPFAVGFGEAGGFAGASLDVAMLTALGGDAPAP